VTTRLHAELQAWRTRIGAPMPVSFTPENDSANPERDNKDKQDRKSQKKQKQKQKQKQSQK
jgi:hypothetical protein